MYYIKSTTQKTYSVMGKIIPACVTRNNEYLKAESDFVTEMKKIPVVKSLIDAGAILILDKAPAEIENSIEGLTSSNAALIAKNTELQAKIKELEANTNVDDKVAKVEAEARALIDDRDAEIARLKARLEEAEAKIVEE